MNMKRAAIIFLALIVWFFLIPGAFAGEYMVILVGVDSGHVVEVYDANAPASNHPSNPNARMITCTNARPHQGPSHQPVPPPDPIISRNCIETIFAASSPGCRYILHPNGYYVKVCNP
jgi:hypothetical protein